MISVSSPRQHCLPAWSLFLLAALALAPAPAVSQEWHQHPYWTTPDSIPVSGRPVPELAWVDTQMREFMQARSIPGGVFGIMRNDRIVYLRGFGHDFNKNPLPENTPFRLASVSKTITAAAARHLISTGAIGLNDFVFDRGQLVNGVPVGGILPASLYSAPGTEDSRVPRMRVNHLIHHRSGWYTGIDGTGNDYAFHDRECANRLGIASPPGSRNKIRCILEKQTGFEPGTDVEYSNINTLILGEIVKHVSGLSIEEYVRRHVMRWQIGIPATEIFGGRTFRNQQNPREPYYKTLNAHPASATGPWLVENVIGGMGSGQVERPYGGHHVEAAVPFGDFTASAAAMLEFANHYDVRYSTDLSSTFGMPLGSGLLPEGGGHNGSLDGYETRLFQEDRAAGQRLRWFVAFNARSNSDNFYRGHWPRQFLDSVRPTLLAGHNWSENRSDGFWTRLGSELNQGVGGYHAPFRGFQRMLNQTTQGSTIRLLPGTQNWTGVLDRPMVIDAPEGIATLGSL